jgi:S1-C subfamily serine protease
MTEHGNSGGPVIDPATGDVYAIVRAKLKDSNEADLAIGITRVVIPFLTKHNVRYVSASNSGASIGDSSAIQEPDVVHVLPGANKVAMNSARLRQRQSTVYASATRSGLACSTRLRRGAS